MKKSNTKPRSVGRVVATHDGWAVEFEGSRCSPRFQDKGPARAYLKALREGRRKPEVERR